jgi:protein-tyrosine phosphatase
VRRILPHALWVGHVGGIRNLRAVLEAGIVAIVDLAVNEPVPTITRELVYCRFPLVDGTGNAPWLLRAAVEVTAGFLRAKIPVLVYCAAGMSRTPTIAAAALSLATAQSPDECLAIVTAGGASDVTPVLWSEVKAAMLV